MRRVALITGGSRGIGFGIARELAQNNFDLAINGTRSAAEVENALKELREHGVGVMYCPGDIASSGDRTEILRQVKDHYGALHVLVNNAGVAPKERRDILDATEESFDYVMGINLKGSWFLTQKTANWMIGQKKMGTDFKGCIINISSDVRNGGVCKPRRILHFESGYCHGYTIVCRAAGRVRYSCF